MDRTMAGERVFPDKPPVTALGLAKSIDRFTERELDVLRLLAEGLTDKEIGGYPVPRRVYGPLSCE